MQAPTLSREELVNRLTAHRLIGGVPRNELEWLADHGVYRTYEAGEVVARKGEHIPDFNIVLAGRFGIHVEERHGWRRVLEWTAGDLAGLIPYSRMNSAPGNSIVEEATEALGIHESLFPLMVRECPNVTAIAVHVMLDRARTFNAAQLQDEKMISLGRVAAGLAHELNNPASAAVRSAQHLSTELQEADIAARALGALDLTDEQGAAIEKARRICLDCRAPATLSPLERADHEEALTIWLTEHEANDSIAPTLADAGIELNTLDTLAEAVSGKELDTALRWIASGCNTQALGRDIERATSRIFELVSSIKRFTHMDRAQVAEPVDVGQLLADTVTVLASKARKNSVALGLHIEPNLPKAAGFGGELNQVWMNLIDNAIDAAPNDGSGKVTVTAKLEHGFLAVRITDNGRGIPEDVRPRIFDPFFTTKPPGEGTGLGLDIVQRIVRRHRAEIDVESRPGHTTFRVGLPLGALVSATA